MWIVRVALDRPYTFIILALLILLLSPVVILRTRSAYALHTIHQCFAFHILRDEVGPAFFGGASIVYSSDVRVFERREDLTLPLEPLNNLTGGRFRRDHFDRHLLLEHSVVSPGQIDRTHASAANLARVT